MPYYKVLRPDLYGTLYSIGAPTLLIQRYLFDRIATPQLSNSALFVFDSLVSVRHYMRNQPFYCVASCTGELFEYQPCRIPHGSRPREFIMEFWKYLHESKGMTLKGASLRTPKGTVFLKNLKLKKVM